MSLQTLFLRERFIKCFNENKFHFCVKQENIQLIVPSGPYHPAFRELCISQRCLDRIKRQLTNTGNKEYIIKVNPKELSQWKGQKNSNITSLGSMGYTVQIVADSALPKGEFTIDQLT